MDVIYGGRRDRQEAGRSLSARTITTLELERIVTSLNGQGECDAPTYLSLCGFNKWHTMSVSVDWLVRVARKVDVSSHLWMPTTD